MQYLILAVLIYLVIYMLDFKGYRRDGKQWAHIIERERYCCEHGRQRTASQFCSLRGRARKNPRIARDLDAFEQSMAENEMRNYNARRTQASLDELNRRLFDIQMRM